MRAKKTTAREEGRGPCGLGGGGNEVWGADVPIVRGPGRDPVFPRRCPGQRAAPRPPAGGAAVGNQPRSMKRGNHPSRPCRILRLRFTVKAKGVPVQQSLLNFPRKPCFRR